LLALVLQALLHEFDVVSDRLVEFVDRLAAEDAAPLVVGGGSKRRNRDLVEILLEILLRYPAVGLLAASLASFARN
jgi:hypothetical protein